MILLIVFILIAIVATVFLVYQRNNIQALLYARKYSGEELAEKTSDINGRIKTVLEQVLDIPIEPLSEEELQKLGMSETSREEVLEIITGSSKNVSKTGEKTKSKVNSAKINDLIAEVYLLKADYLNRIDGLLSQGRSEWRAIPYEDRTLTLKLTLAEKYMAKGSQLEVECDKKMDALLVKLENELKVSGESTKVIAEITTLYNEEKAVKKAALLEKYYPQ